MLQWIHKTWVYFWRTMLVLLGILLLLGGGFFGLLQLEPTKQYISSQLEKEFNRQYEGELGIGELEGLLPFNFQFKSVTIRARDLVDSTDNPGMAGQSPIISVDTVSIGIDLSGLLRRSLVIDRLNIQNPRINLVTTDTGGYTIQQALHKRQETDIRGRKNVFSRMKVVAPYLEVRNGNVTVDKWPESFVPSWNMPEPFTAGSINLSLYVELSDKQRFLDIEYLSAKMPSLELQEVESSGQIFSEDSLLEFNGFEIKTLRSSLNITGRISGVDFDEGRYTSQLRRAQYNISIDPAYINLKEWEEVFAGGPVLDETIGIRGDIRGDHNELVVDRFQFFAGNNRVGVSGNIQNLLNRSDFRYRLRMDTVDVNRSDFRKLMNDSSGWTNGSWEKIKGNARLSGTADSVNADIRLLSDRGSVNGSFKASVQPPYTYRGSLEIDSLNLASWLPGQKISRSRINASFTGSGMGIQWQDAIWNLEGTISESFINNIPLENLNFRINFIEGFIEPSFTLTNPGGEQVKGDGWVDLKQRPAKLKYSGSARNLNLRHFLTDEYINSTRLNLDFNMDLTGNSLSAIHGLASVDVSPSVIGKDSVQSHTFYADLDEPGSKERKLRLTSSLVDAEISGNVVPERIIAMYNHWKPYLSRVFRKKILLESTDGQQAMHASDSSLKPVDLSANIQLKEVGLLNRYADNLPTLSSNSAIDAHISVDTNKVLFRSVLNDSRLQIDSLNLENPSLQITGDLTYDEDLKNIGSLNIEAGFEALTYKESRFHDYKGSMQFENDSVEYEHEVVQPESNAQFSMKAHAGIADTALKARVTRFNVGNEKYTWSNVENPVITYMRSGKLKLEQFRFRSQEEEFRIEGVYSSSLKDSVNYDFRNIQLHRVSQMIGGRVDFGGTLNGNFYTRALTSQPSIEGEINIRQFTLNDRTVGDIQFKSVYSPEDKFFDTQINIQTDSTRYADYLKQNEGIGQDIRMDGFLQPPNIGGSKENLFKFNIDFREIDMWVIREIVPDIFDDVEGRAEGSGWIAGSLSDYDFNAGFDVRETRVNTPFLNTSYLVNGHVEFDKDKGLVFHEVQLSDQQGGTGNVVGSVDINDFDPVKYFDLTLSMNRLQFLNSRMDQDVPFFGEMYGSGQIRLSGTNKNPYLFTAQAIRVSKSSTLSIPLMEETELNKDSRFIQFVDQFETSTNFSFNRKDESAGFFNGNQDSDDKSFVDLFRLDLQFGAPENTTVKLIFDPVTGEVLTAQGTGQLNIRLEDGEIQMFGNYNIENGSYQFVSGDIFTRTFNLESGGRLTWQGDPENAELDVTAVYEARPSVSSLMGNRRTADNTNRQNIQNIPVNLVLHITGTLGAINNEFYFRLPNTMEISQNVAIANRISQLNRDNEQKLLQATSLLLTGEFIPVTADGMSSDQPYFGDNLSGSSVVLNPLLSNQVFSPLLSNQINSLLNSDISSLDVDINLNAYNQVDLGIALRLYDNRLVLRREGQVTGPQSNLGSLGATYRISRSLSVKAFHRQDLTLSNLTNTQTQVEYLNGAGIEARVQFNSWKELTRRFFNSVKNLFTADKAVREEEKEDELAEINEEED